MAARKGAVGLWILAQLQNQEDQAQSCTKLVRQLLQLPCGQS